MPHLDLSRPTEEMPPVQPSALRLFRFRPTSPSFDAKLRARVVPDLLRLPEMLGIVTGRAGPDIDGTRLIASVWSSMQAMEDALGAGGEAGHTDPELFEGTTDAQVDSLCLAFSLPPDRPDDVRILRLVRGTTRPGQLAAYVHEASHGTLTDRASDVGPQALFLAVSEPDRFATLSLWDEWAHVEAATGADVGSVERTRHAELLESWSAEHYEVIPGIPITIAGQPEGQPA